MLNSRREVWNPKNGQSRETPFFYVVSAGCWESERYMAGRRGRLLNSEWRFHGVGFLGEEKYLWTATQQTRGSEDRALLNEKRVGIQ